MTAPRITAEEIAAYRTEYSTSIYAGHTVSHVNRILDALESAYAELDSLGKHLSALQARYDERWGDLKEWATSPKELRRYGWWKGEKWVDGVGLFPVGASEGSVPFQAFRSISDPQGLLRSELDRLSAQGGEVPGWDVNKFANHIGIEGAFSAGDIRVFFAGAKACHEWIRANLRLSPPHPDTVEVSREDIGAAVTAIRAASRYIGKQAPIWSEHATGVADRLDALRAQAQPAAEREGA